MNAAIHCGMATNTVDASVKLQFWSQTLKNAFKEQNTNPSDERRNVLRRGGTQDQLQKMNENVIKLIQARAEMQEQLNKMLQVNRTLQEEVASLKTQVKSLVTAQFNTMTNVRWVMVQNRAIMRHLMIPINEAVEAQLPGANDPLQRPDIDFIETGFRVGVAARAPPPLQQQLQNTAHQRQSQENNLQNNQRQPNQQLNNSTSNTTGNAGTPTVPLVIRNNPARTVNNGLSGHRVSQPGQNNRGAMIATETLDSVLKYLYEYPGNSQLGSLLTGAVFLSHLTTHVHHSVFQAKTGAASKIRKVLTFVDAIWTEEERGKLAGHTFASNIEAFTLINHLTQRVKQAVHVLRNPKPKTWKVTGSSKAGIQGLANNIPADWNKLIQDYVPQWDKPNNPRKSASTLQAYVEAKTNELKQEIESQRRLQNNRRRYIRNR